MASDSPGRSGGSFMGHYCPLAKGPSGEPPASGCSYHEGASDFGVTGWTDGRRLGVYLERVDKHFAHLSLEDGHRGPVGVWQRIARTRGAACPVTVLYLAAVYAGRVLLATQGASTADVVFYLVVGAGLLIRLGLFCRKVAKRRRARRALPAVQSFAEVPAAPTVYPIRGPRVLSRGRNDRGAEFIRVLVPPPAPVIRTPVASTPASASAPFETSFRITDEESQAANGKSTADGHTRSPAPDAAPASQSSETSAQAARSIEVGVLGTVEVTGCPELLTKRKLVELLCLLAVNKERPVSTEQLRTALWSGDSGPDGSPKTLRNLVSMLRDAVGDEIFPPAERGRGYLAGPGLTCDLVRFESLAVSARGLADRDAVPLLDEALALVRGVPFQGTEPGTYAWAGALIAEIEVAVVAVAIRLATIRLEGGEPHKARSAATRGLVGVPYDLSLWTMVLEAGRRLGPIAYEHAARDCRLVLGEATELLPNMPD